MGTCRQCGREIGFWSGGICAECWREEEKNRAEEKKRAQIEARKKEEEEASFALRTLFAKHVPGQSATILGAARWSTLGSLVNAGMGKMIFGGWGGSAHRAGIVAVTHSDLFVLDLVSCP